MLEDEIDSQGIDKCKMVEKGIDWETVQSPEMTEKIEMTQKIAYEQEKCMKEEICNRPLPRLYRAKKRVHETKLETPKINAVEISELPRKVKFDTGYRMWIQKGKFQYQQKYFE